MPHCKETQWNSQAVDIIPATGGKQNGIHEVLKYYSINQSETMSFGDGKNDIEICLTIQKFLLPWVMQMMLKSFRLCHR